MAYQSQNTDFAAKLSAVTIKFLESLDEFRALAKYYSSQVLYVDPESQNTPKENFPDDTVVHNGITYGEIKGVLSSMEAIDAFITTNYHYTNLNKVR